MVIRHTAPRLGVLLAAFGLAVVACTGNDDTSAPPPDNEASVAEGDAVTDDGVVTSGADVDCSLEALNRGDEEFVFTSAYVVEDGRLGERCFGDDDEVVFDAWAVLATIAPQAQLGDLTLFGGFEPDGGEASETMAFVDVLDADGISFQMSINTVEAVADPDELLLTMAHEFTHVFTATPAQLDRSDEAFDDCGTYFNGDGCYVDDSLMLAWIDEFWAADVLAAVDPEVDSVADADERCFDDDGFFGPYAATNPEEDFAEAFGAFVFRLEPATPGQAERLAWIAAQPGLAEFRDRADAAGLTPLANNFDVCGT